MSAAGRPLPEGRRPERALETASGRIPLLWLAGGLLALGVGAAGFWLAVGADPRRAWMSVWMNFLLFSSVAIAGVVFGAVLSAAKGHWGKGFRRLAEAAGAFLPASLVLFFLLLTIGAEHVFPWLGEVEVHLNRAWLDLDTMVWRDGGLLIALYGLAFAFLWYSARADAPLIAERHGGWRRGLARLLSRGWRGDEEEVARCRRIIARLSPVLILGWALVYTVVSVDLAMSLTPGFFSMIWGPYFFVGGWLAMLALVAVVANGYQNGGAPLWDRWEFHDLGKLIFAFSIFWTYLWFSQYLVIWYGNLPHEVQWFVPRSAETFAGIYWLQMVLIFGLPFVLLLGRKPKMNPAWLAFVSCLILVGFWIERYNLVVPAVWRGEGIPLGWPELTITLGFAGLFALCYAAWSTTFPKVPIRETIAVGTAGKGP